MNNIIADDDELQSKFNDMAIMKAKGYLTNFEPYNSRIPNKLFRMGLLPKTFNKNKLLISGGSDYHGDNKPKIKLGIGCGNLAVPFDYAKKLKQALKT